MRPRIVVDARFISTSGIGRYIREVLRHLLPDARFSNVTLLGRTGELREFLDQVAASTEHVRLIEFRAAMYSFALHVGWIRLSAVARLQADVTFFPHYDVPLFGLPRASVVTVHDLTHFKIPGAASRVKRLFGGLMLNRSIHQAGRILTVSESTRRDIIDRFPFAASKTTVIPQGVGEDFGSTEQVPIKPGTVPCRYLLSVGNRKPHKNLVAIVEVMALLAEEDPELRIVFAGRPFPAWPEVLRRARELKVSDRIIDLGEVSEPQLRDLYLGAEALVFPSFYEGFGLPVLEAMVAGTPVIASNRSSLPEVAGDAAILLDPTDYAGMAASIRRLRKSPFERTRLIERGRARAAGFTWEATASKTVQQLLEVASGQAFPKPGSGDR